MKAIAGQPSFKMLICLIEIWDASGSENMIAEPENPMIITEAMDIEINESYKNLFSKASVKFPRGTVIKRTVTGENIKQSGVTANIDESGVLVTTRINSYRASVENFKVGQRIRIHLGYTTDTEIYNLTKTVGKKKSVYNDLATRRRYISAMTPTENGNGSAIMFDGYVVKCSIDEPIEIECEDLASQLKKITCPKIPGNKNWTVQDFFADDGQWKLLSKSGLKLHPDNDKIEIGKTEVPDSLTVADVLTTWAKNVRLFSFVRPDNDGNPCLMIGRSYFSGNGKDNIALNDSTKNPDIDFAYHVADNNLTLMDTDKAFLAVTAECWENIEGKGKKYSITVRKNPDYDPSDPSSKPYQILNETTISKKAMKAGACVLSKSKDRIDLSTYNIIPYFSRNIGISHEQLQLEAIKYFESYNANGIEGTLTLFGDFNMRSATKVHLKDDRFPAKNGYYFVDEVTTKFGVGGYRQTIKLPHCISRDKDKQEENK